MNPMLFIDFYKAGHKFQYPKGTSLIYSNFTPRKSRTNIQEMTFFGLQYIVQEYLIEQFNKNFFERPMSEVLGEYRQVMDDSLGGIDTRHIVDLHSLGYLPLKIKALPEGTAVPMGTPCVTMWNTKPEFFWLTNYLETLLSCQLWKPCTSATTSRSLRQAFEKYAKLTGGDIKFVPFQGHDFSLRGMSNIEDGCSSGAAHLLHFLGTDTVPAIPWLKKYYAATGPVGYSVAATEHSVMCAGGDDDEYETYVRLLTEVYPKGILSIVSDTWDFWNVVTNYMPRLKPILDRRQGKLVLRPDSGTPHLIINGDPNADNEAAKKGLVRCLYEIFGGTKNGAGFIDLNPAVGFIYGDGIDFAEQGRILQGLMDNGFSTTCGVLGFGSYSYQYVTRDTYGTVCKATYCEIDGKPKNLFKAPKTGAWKTSHKGLLRVNDDLSVTQEVTWEQEGGLLEPVFEDGKMLRFQTFDDVRSKCGNYL